MSKWIGSFGQGWKLRKNFVRVEAESEDDALAKMKAGYGTAFSHVYAEDEGIHLKWGWTEVPFGTPNERL